MYLLELSKQLRSIAKGPAYVYCPLMDFTQKSTSYIRVYGKEISIKIPLDIEDLPQVKAILKGTIFSSGHSVIAWDIKNLYSYMQHHTKSPLKWVSSGKEISELIGDTEDKGRKEWLTDDTESHELNKTPVVKNPAIFDLKVIERYRGKELAEPQSYIDAMKRLRLVYNKDVANVYNKVHLPLLTQVIPDIETVGIIRDKIKVHANYEVEGQVNGRLKCRGLFARTYNPHVIPSDERFLFKPTCWNCNDVTLSEMAFIELDYNALEVRVLQWLSKDEKLGEMLSGGDVYLNMWNEITGQNETGAEARSFMKGLFLPLVYGAGVATLAKTLNINEETANKLINRTYEVFPDSFAYLESQQNSVKNGVITDCFGRKRVIEAGKEYQVRNFCVQSPASTICLSKLIDLNDMLKIKKIGKIGFYVHDGYVIFLGKSNGKDVVRHSVRVLEAESALAPGLELAVSCHGGFVLNEMKSIK